MKHTARKLIHTDDDMFPFMPKDWISIPLKYVASCNDNLLPESTDKNYEFDYVDISSVKYGEGITGKQRMIFKDAPSRARRIVRVNDIIFSTVRTYLKAVANISDFDYPLIVSTGFAVIRAKKSVIFPNFMKYCLLSDGFISKIDKWSTGSNYPSINAPVIMNQKILLPSISEQQQIAAYLDDKCAKIDEAITKHRTLIEKLKEYRKAVITKAVTKGLDPNVEMKDSGVGSIGLISKSANVIRMKFLSLCPITDGTHQTPEYDDKENGCPFLSSKDITSGKIDWNNIKYITKQLHEILYKTVSPHKGDILLAKNGTTGIAALVEDEKVFDIYVTLALIRPDTTKVISKYLLYAINCSATKEQFNKHLLGIGVPNLHLNVIDNTYIVIHDISIQEKIVSFLDTKCAKIDEAITRHEGLITKLEEYKKSIIYNAVTGKIDCRKDAE